jgi:hypothetical protein
VPYNWYKVILDFCYLTSGAKIDMLRSYIRGWLCQPFQKGSPMKIVLFSALLSLLAASCSQKTEQQVQSSKTVSSKVIVDYDATKLMNKGEGYDLIENKVLANCLEKSELERIQLDGENGKFVTFSMKKVTDYQSLIRELNLGPEVSFIAGPLNLKAKAKFFNKIALNDYSAFALIKISSLSSSWTLRNPVVKENLKGLLDERDSDVATSKGQRRFRKSCGDGFIQGFSKGGEFFALLEVKTNSKEEQRKVALSLSGLEKFFNLNDSSFDWKKSFKKKKTTFHFYQAGGNHAATIPTEVERLIERAKNFAAELSGDNEVILKAKILPYETLGYNTLDITSIEEFYQDLSAVLYGDALLGQAGLIKTLGNIKYILENIQEFENPNMVTLGSAVKEIQGKLQTVKLLVRKCQKELKSFKGLEKLEAVCLISESLNDISIELPKRVEKHHPDTGHSVDNFPTNYSNSLGINWMEILFIALNNF